jgi:hypothetical protein
MQDRNFGRKEPGRPTMVIAAIVLGVPVILLWLKLVLWLSEGVLR